jgi:hypothetical protein
MKLSRIAFYTFVFAIFAIFIKIIIQFYMNFFNERRENDIMLLTKLKNENLPKECEFKSTLPSAFTGEEEIILSFSPVCETQVINILEESFINKKAGKKFVKLANKNSTSLEVERVGNKYSFNVHTVLVQINRGDKTEITIKNLNTKHVQADI